MYFPDVHFSEPGHKSSGTENPHCIFAAQSECVRILLCAAATLDDFPKTNDGQSPEGL
jgi:hypothetical protein